MESIAPLVTYASVVVFAVAVVVRFLRIQRYPMNVRWEIYPIPHEGERAEHGGSRLEETDWWKRQHAPDRANQMKHMIQEMVFIQALKENNPKMWTYSFPFHFGLYLTAAWGGLLLLLAILGLAEVSLDASISVYVGYFGVAAMGLSCFGALGLMSMRATDPGLRAYSTFAHFFNLLVIVGTLALVIFALYNNGFDAAPFVAYAAGLVMAPVTLDMAGATPADPFVAYAVIAASALLAYIPLTHMSHFFVKWFTWDKIRWDDEPNVRGGRIEKLIEQALAYKVTWAADHIRGDGKKSWADVATEELKSE